MLELFNYKRGKERKCYCNPAQIPHPSIHSFIQCQPVSVWNVGYRGWRNSYQKTQMNQRGWSCWMLPSRPDPIQCEAGSLPLGQGAITAFRAFRRRRCLHVTAISGCLTSPTISCLAGQRVHRPSGSASRCPALGGEELPPPPPHARKEEGKEAREGGWKVQDLFWRHVGKAHKHGSERCGSVNAPHADGIRSSGADCCTRQLWIPCATLRIVINTLHCSEDAPS